MYIDPWEQFQSESSSAEAWQGSSQQQSIEDGRSLYAMRGAEKAETTAATESRDRITALGRKNRTEDRKTEFGKKYRNRETGEEESNTLFKAMARIGLERSYVRRDVDEAEADVNGDLPRGRTPSPRRQLPSSPQQPWLSQQDSASTSQLNNAMMPLEPDIEALYTNPWEPGQASGDESFGKDSGFSRTLSNSHVDQFLPSDNGIQSGSTNRLPDNIDASWQSSPYSFVRSGQIGNPPDMTTHRSNGTRISQNIRAASATLRRDPTRKENLEMAASMAFSSPSFDMGPDGIAYGVVSSSLWTPSPSPKKVATPKAQTSKPEVSKTTTAKKKAEAKPVTAKAETPKPKAPPLSRDQEHKSHLDKLSYLETCAKCWSGTGQKCDVKSSALSATIKSQLNVAKLLGSGGFAIVHRVVLSGVPLARKGINVHTPTQLDDIKTEVDHVKSLSGHKHIVQLVGTYVDDTHPSFDTFYILTFPVADCDMSNFLAEYEKSPSPTTDSGTIAKLCNAAGIAATNSRYTPFSALLQQFLKQTLGCITTAIAFMHSHKISHDDIKPANILLRSGCIYITDFGISRNRQLATQTSTELNPGRTLGWSAPEKDEQERHNPFQADIYSLGCIFMHVISLLSGKKNTKDCALILHNYPVHREPGILRHFEELAEAQWTDGTSWEGWMKLMALAMQMLSNDRHTRPIIEDVNSRLAAIGGAERRFHNVCCRQTTSLAETTIKPTPQSPQPSIMTSEAGTIPNSRDVTIRPPPKQTSPAPGVEHNGDSTKTPPSPAEDDEKKARPLPKPAPHRRSNTRQHVAVKGKDARMKSVQLGAKEPRTDPMVEPVSDTVVQDAAGLV